jgi:dethiobiotin synthetase
VQTGHSDSTSIADDILLHRRLMNLDLLPEDRKGETCPFAFEFPASPHLAAALEHRTVEPSMITAATQRLLLKYEIVLLEGAGGLYVPLTRNYLTADYVQDCGYPLILVTSGKLGSINHTLLTLEAIQTRKIPLAGIVFNQYRQQGQTNETIQQDSLEYFRYALEKIGYKNIIAEIPAIDFNAVPDIDFSALFS